MFALQSPVGLRFGATLQVGSDRVTFEMELKIPKGIECPFRMELSGIESTVMGTVRIERALPQRGGGTPRYQAKIIAMPDGDRATFDGWRRDLATGGVSRHLERDPTLLKEQMSSQMMRGLSETEAKAVLERMNKRRSAFSQTKEAPVPDFGLTSEQESAPDKEERAQMHEQLKANRVEQPQIGSGGLGAAVPLNDAGFATVDLEPEEEEVPEEEIEVEDADEPAWMPRSTVTVDNDDAAVPVQAGAMPAPTPHADPAASDLPSPPIVVVNADAEPIELTIIYLSSESFIADFERTLHTSAVTIEHPDLSELYRPLNVKIQLADGQSVETIGHSVAVTDEGMAIAMELDVDQRALLKAAAGKQ